MKTVFSVSLVLGLDSMFPARSRRSASHVAGDVRLGFPKKLGGRVSGEAGIDGYNLHSPPRLWRTNHVQAVSGLVHGLCCCCRGDW